MSITYEMLNSKQMVSMLNFELRQINRQEKEDVKQNCIVEILRTFSNREIFAEDEFHRFCRTIIRRTVVDYYRKSNRKVDKSQTLVNFCDGADEDNGSTVDNFSYKVDDFNYELAEVINDYLANKHMFTEREREVIDFLLFHPNGVSMSMTEIANELNINKSHGSRAFNKLKEIVRK